MYNDKQTTLLHWDDPIHKFVRMHLPEKVDKGGSLVEAKELSENLLSVSKHFSRFRRGSSSARSLWVRDSVHDDMDDAIKKHVTFRRLLPCFEMCSN